MFLNQLSEKEKESFVQLSYHIITKDGEYADQESQILLQYANEMGIDLSDYEFDETINEDSLIGSFRNSTDDIVRKVFIELMGLVLVDRAYDKTEEEILRKYASEYNLGMGYLEEAKNWVEKMNGLYKELANLI